MRRILAATVLGAMLMAAAACTDQSGSPTVSASGSAASGAATSRSAAPTYSVSPADTKVCEDTRTLITDSTRKFGEQVVKAIQGGGGEPAAVAAVKTLFTDWANGLRVQAGKAANPDLKSALLQYATGLEQVNAKISTVADLTKLQDLNTPELNQATDKVQQICG